MRIQQYIQYWFGFLLLVIPNLTFAAPSCSSQNVKNQVIQLVNQVYTEQANDFMNALIFGTGKKTPAEQVFRGEVSAIRSDQATRTSNYVYCKAQLSGHLPYNVVENLSNNEYYQAPLIGGCYQSKIQDGCAATIEYAVEITEDNQQIIELYNKEHIENFVTHLYEIFISHKTIKKANP